MAIKSVDLRLNGVTVDSGIPPWTTCRSQIALHNLPFYSILVGLGALVNQGCNIGQLIAEAGLTAAILYLAVLVPIISTRQAIRFLRICIAAGPLHYLKVFVCSFPKHSHDVFFQACLQSSVAITHLTGHKRTPRSMHFKLSERIQRDE